MRIKGNNSKPLQFHNCFTMSTRVGEINIMITQLKIFVGQSDPGNQYILKTKAGIMSHHLKIHYH